MSFLKRETPHNHKDYAGLLLSYYTIPRNNRELQHGLIHTKGKSIIPYQEIIGNYSHATDLATRYYIIPYQEIIGNYSFLDESQEKERIIPYQEIIGNYSAFIRIISSCIIIPYQEIIGNYSPHLLPSYLYQLSNL